MKKLFIVLEGIDGAGTTTQANLLKDYFLSIGEGAIISPEPSSGPIGKFIREAMQKPALIAQTGRKYDEQMAYLFAADRHYHLYNEVDGVLKTIEKDDCHVISTRYYFSSLAYNCYTREQFDLVSLLNRRFPPPDVAIYLDVPVEVSWERIKQRTHLEIYENKEKLIKVKQNFDYIFACHRGNLLKLDGREEPREIHEKIISYLRGLEV